MSTVTDRTGGVGVTQLSHMELIGGCHGLTPGLPTVSIQDEAASEDWVGAAAGIQEAAPEQQEGEQRRSWASQGRSRG